MATRKNIVLISPKGGVGKSTITANLAASYSQMRKKILLLELDHQLALQNHFSSQLNAGNYGATTSDSGAKVLNGTQMDMVRTAPGIDILPFPHSQYYMDEQSSIGESRNGMVSEALNNNQYDLVLIDTVSGSDSWMDIISSGNCLALICINPDAASYSTVVRVLENIRKVSSQGTSVPYRLLVNRMDSSRAISADTHAIFNEMFREKLIDSCVPDDPVFADSFAKGKPVNAISPYSKASTSFDELAKNLLDQDWDSFQ